MSSPSLWYLPSFTLYLNSRHPLHHINQSVFTHTGSIVRLQVTSDPMPSTGPLRKPPGSTSSCPLHDYLHRRLHTKAYVATSPSSTRPECILDMVLQFFLFAVISFSLLVCYPVSLLCKTISVKTLGYLPCGFVYGVSASRAGLKGKMPSPQYSR